MIEINMRGMTARGKERGFWNAGNSLYLGLIGDVGVLI